jgi:hypothetical protein
MKASLLALRPQEYGAQPVGQLFGKQSGAVVYLKRLLKG